MAKSMRSKTKRAHRRAKRESGVYAAADAARLQRVSQRLKATATSDKDGDAAMEEEELQEEAEEVQETEGGGEAPSNFNANSRTATGEGHEDDIWMERLCHYVGFMDPEALGEGRFELMSLYDDDGNNGESHEETSAQEGGGEGSENPRTHEVRYQYQYEARYSYRVEEWHEILYGEGEVEQDEEDEDAMDIDSN